MFFFIREWDFYTPFVPDVDPSEDDSANACFENTALFLFANFQYLMACVAFSISKPFRQPLYTNYAFTIAILLLLGMNIYMSLSNDQWLGDYLYLELTPTW